MRNISKSGSPLDPDVARIEELVLGLGRAARGLRDPVSAACGHLALTPPQVHALIWLGWDGALTMGELARRGGVTEKTITGVVDRMEDAKLLHRMRDDKDRRVVHVALTPGGQKIFEEMREGMRARVARFLQLLDRDDRSDLLRILEKLGDRIKHASAEAREGPKENP